jgi:hypothetical protein
MRGDAGERVCLFEARNVRQQFQELFASVQGGRPVRVLHPLQVCVPKLPDELTGAQGSGPEPGRLLACADEHAEGPAEIPGGLDGEHGS